MKQKERSAASWLLEFAGSHRRLYLASIFFGVCGVACAVAPYVIMADVVTRLLSGSRKWEPFLKDGVFMALFWAGRVIFHACSTSCSHMATFHVLGNIRKRVCDKLSRVPLGRVKDTPSGSLKNVIVERVDSIETTLAHVVPEFTANLLAPVAVFVYLLIIDWRMAFVSLITLPLGMIAYMSMMIGYEESYGNTVRKTKILNDTAVEYINGIEVIKAFGKAKSSYEKFKVAAREGADCYIEWMRRCDIPFSIAMMVMPCTTLSVVPIGGIFLMNGSLSAGDFALCVILSLGLITPLITVMSYSDDIAKIRTIVGEVTDILTWEELKRPQKREETPQGCSVELDNVTFGYHEKEVLHGITMKIQEGTVNALVGPSGSGKSTIARLIASLWDVKGGSIKIGGADIRRMDQESYNRLVAFVSQDNFLFDDTIRENIRMGRHGATDQEVEKAAKDSGCHEFIMELEKGYDTVVGTAEGHLSGGERQRIAIARAMLKNAPIVILDEATAYTDPENEAVIQASVARLVRGRTLIVIAHRLSTITDADRIFVVDKGLIAEEGSHEELLERHGLYEQMWEAHRSVRDKEEDLGGEAYA